MKERIEKLKTFVWKNVKDSRLDIDKKVAKKLAKQFEKEINAFPALFEKIENYWVVNLMSKRPAEEVEVRSQMKRVELRLEAVVRKFNKLIPEFPRDWFDEDLEEENDSELSKSLESTIRVKPVFAEIEQSIKEYKSDAWMAGMSEEETRIWQVLEKAAEERRQELVDQLPGYVLKLKQSQSHGKSATKSTKRKRKKRNKIIQGASASPHDSDAEATSTRAGQGESKQKYYIDY